MPPTISPQQFVAKWKKIDLTERQSAQTHFNELCAMLGVATPLDADPSGTWYAFEKSAAKGTKGGQGWADVWMRNFFAWEYKRNHASLTKAYEQLQQYREALENPPLLIVGDNQRIEVHTNFTNTVKKVAVFTLDDFLIAERRDLFRKIFNHPEAFKAPVTTAEVTEQAAREFAKIADIMRKQGVEPSRAAHFLIRLLFCLFAEDIGLLPEQLFTNIVNSSVLRPAAVFAGKLRPLFAAMSQGISYGPYDIRHFNGGLFDSDDIIEIDYRILDILQRVCALDWSNVEPAILGTLFERSLDPTTRAPLGAHYTSKEDILLIVEPVLMTPLRREWEQVKERGRKLAQDRATAANRSSASRYETELQNLLSRFSYKIGQVQVLDPACGSGNFLYVALKQLLDLQKEIDVFARDLNLTGISPSVNPEQMHGIEVNEYAHELAKATLWIGYIQWLRENGYGEPGEPILKPLENILKMDAILAYDAQGKPIEPEWPQADVIIGNPPFLGGSKLRRELGDKYTEDLWKLYEDRVPGGADFVCYWYEKTRELIALAKTRRAGLLATQAIRAGASRSVLERIKKTGNIFMAWSNRPWMLEGASVRVSIVGFDDGTEQARVLDGESVISINSDLSSTIDLVEAKQLEENKSFCYKGDEKGGPFEINNDFAQKLLKTPINPNGQFNKLVIRPWVNGQDITGRLRNFWIIDFGVYMPLEDAALYELPFDYVQTKVKPVRLTNNRTAYREKWWIHAEARPGMRKAISSLKRYIATPRVAKHRLFVWLDSNTLPDSRLYVFARDDDYFFGILHSRLHEVWSLATSSRHGVGNDPTYNNTTCFETFPFPWLPGKEPQGDARVVAIAVAAKRLVELRDNWLNPAGADEAELKKRTLTNLYNQRPTWLQNAHDRLDNAVLDAYGWPYDLTDEQILERLLALNLERAASQKSEVRNQKDEEEESEAETGE